MDIGSFARLKSAYLGMPVRDRMVLIGQLRDKFTRDTAGMLIERLRAECQGPVMTEDLPPGLQPPAEAR